MVESAHPDFQVPAIKSPKANASSSFYPPTSNSSSAPSNPASDSSEGHEHQRIGTPIRVVITGGAGFIGSHIADECVRRGWQVTILDNLSTGRIANIQHLLKGRTLRPDSSTAESALEKPPSPSLVSYDSQLKTQNSCTFLHGSITDLALLQNLFQGVDYVFHQAALASVPGSVNNPLSYHETNLTGSLNVLLAARDNHVKKVVCASSSAIYGNEPAQPKREDMQPDPQSPYAVTKLAMEYYCDIFNKLYSLPAVCLRYFNVFGPRQDPASEYAAVIPKFIEKIQAGRSLIVYGDGEQTRDFVYVKDVVAANLLAAESKAAGVYNVGSGLQFSVNNLAYILLKITGREDLPVSHQDARAGDVKHSVADITSLTNLGYQPHYTLQSGLREMLDIQVMQIAPLDAVGTHAYSYGNQYKRRSI